MSKGTRPDGQMRPGKMGVLTDVPNDRGG